MWYRPHLFFYPFFREENLAKRKKVGYRISKFAYTLEEEEKMNEFVNVAEIFGENVFNDTVMQERLPKKIYKDLKKTIEDGKELDLATADVIAHEMKEWAIEKGATALHTLVSAFDGGNC